MASGSTGLRRQASYPVRSFIATVRPASVRPSHRVVPRCWLVVVADEALMEAVHGGLYVFTDEGYQLLRVEWSVVVGGVL